MFVCSFDMFQRNICTYILYKKLCTKATISDKKNPKETMFTPKCCCLKKSVAFRR